MRFLFVSSWMRDPGAGGIWQYKVNEDGTLELVSKFLENVSFNVSYVDKSRSILYALNEEPNQPGFRFGGGGSVYAFHLDSETGNVLKIDRYPSCCSNPCNLAINPEGNRMIVTGHGTKSYVTRLVESDKGWHTEVLTDSTPVILFQLNPDGSIGDILDARQHEGSGPTKKQMTPHPHSAVAAPFAGLYGICDKGNDNVYMYKIADNKLVCCGKSSLPAGTEPRYAVFHPQKRFFYHNNENTTDICAYSYDDEGNLEWIGTYEAVSPEFKNAAAKKTEQQGLCISSDGRFIYDVVNGPNIIAVFEINQADGSLTLIQNVKTGSDWPRGNALSADGRFMAAACVSGKKIIIYKVETDGTLKLADSMDQENAAFAAFWDTEE